MPFELKQLNQACCWPIYEILRTYIPPYSSLWLRCAFLLLILWMGIQGWILQEIWIVFPGLNQVRSKIPYRLSCVKIAHFQGESCSAMTVIPVGINKSSLYPYINNGIPLWYNSLFDQYIHLSFHRAVVRIYWPIHISTLASLFVVETHLCLEKNSYWHLSPQSYMGHKRRCGIYLKLSNIRRTKPINSNDSRLIIQLPLPNTLSQVFGQK